MKRPWMPLYVGDYLGDTGHLTTTQHGAYLLLLMHYWRKGALPDDDRQLAKITKLPLRNWQDYRATLQDFFYDGWKHKRIDAELARMLQVSAKRAAAGQKGGLGSALSRMKLEDKALFSRDPSPAIAWQGASKTAARVDHSHSHSSKNLPKGDSPSKGDSIPQGGEAVAADGSRARTGRAPGSQPLTVSPELAAYVASKTRR